MMIKCAECGNTFRIENVIEDELIACPNCEADYKVTFKDGKATLAEFIYETKDLGEL